MRRDFLGELKQSAVDQFAGCQRCKLIHMVRNGQVNFEWDSTQITTKWCSPYVEPDDDFIYAFSSIN